MPGGARSQTAAAEPLGLIAGAGRLPFAIADAARAAGRRVTCVAFTGITDTGLASRADELHWLPLGRLGDLRRAFERAGVGQAVMAGKVEKAHLYADPGALEPDAEALALLAGLADRGDQSILGALADWLSERDVELLPQLALVPDLAPAAGAIGAVRPDASAWEDARFAWPLAKALAARDVGQSLVVRARGVLAVEAIEGTDAAIRRGGELGGPGACVVKVSRESQDPRFDLPAVGPGTLTSMIAVRASLLVVEAGRSLVLDRDALVAAADANGIAVVACPEAGPGALGERD